MALNNEWHAQGSDENVAILINRIFPDVFQLVKLQSMRFTPPWGCTHPWLFTEHSARSQTPSFSSRSLNTCRLSGTVWVLESFQILERNDEHSTVDHSLGEEVMGVEDHKTENREHVHGVQVRGEEGCFLKKEQHMQWSTSERAPGLALKSPMAVSRTGVESRPQWRRAVLKIRLEWATTGTWNTGFRLA